ncbi:MAG: hypothetical protein ACTHNY_05655 [Solirubrobacterales bacterium]
MAGALYFALDDVEERLRDGEKPREDGFFGSDDQPDQSRADELLEAALVSAQRDYEERKLRHFGWLYSSFVFNVDITPANATYLVGVASRLTYHELVLVSLFHADAGYRGLPGWDRLHPFEWQANALAGELYDLAREGLLMRTDQRPVQCPEDANPSRLWVTPAGCKLFHCMRLDRISEEERADAYDEFVEISEIPTPYDLIAQLESAIDSEPLTAADLDCCRLRFQLDERAKSLLPGNGKEIQADLCGSNLEFRVEKVSEHPGQAALTCLEKGRTEFLAVLGIDDGRILRVAPAPDGELAIA